MEVSLSLSRGEDETSKLAEGKELAKTYGTSVMMGSPRYWEQATRKVLH